MSLLHLPLVTPYLLQVDEELLLLLVVQGVRMADIAQRLLALKCWKYDLILAAAVRPLAKEATRPKTYTCLGVQGAALRPGLLVDMGQRGIGLHGLEGCPCKAHHAMAPLPYFHPIFHLPLHLLK